MKKYISLSLAALMLAASLTGCVNKTETNTDPSENTAQTETASDFEQVSENGKLVVGMTLFAPINYYDDNNELIGFDTELAKAVGKKLGLDVEFVEINWDSKEIELNARNIDCIWNGMTITDERKATMSISNPYLRNKQVMIATAENVEKYAADVTGAKVTAELGSAGETIATTDEFFKGSEFIGADAQAKALMEVKAGTSDIAVVDYVLSIGSIGEGTDYADLAVVEAQEFSPEEYGIAFRKGSDITEKVNAAIDELAADGTLTQIAEKYKLQDLLLIK